jgi:hypothetical protein
LRLYSELGDHAGLVAHEVASAVQLHDSRAHDTLAEIFVRRANQQLVHTVVFGCLAGSGSESVIRLIVDHGPHDYSHGFESLFENGELRKQLGSDTFAGLISRIEVVAKRLYDVVGCDPEVSGAALNHRQNGGHDTADGADFLTASVRGGGHSIEVAEQFVGSVD